MCKIRFIQTKKIFFNSLLVFLLQVSLTLFEILGFLNSLVSKEIHQNRSKSDINNANCVPRFLGTSHLPFATGDTAIKLTRAAPVPCPIKVTLSGSPPNAGRFSLSQWRPATRSMRPKLPWALPLAPVFRKPGTYILISCGPWWEKNGFRWKLFYYVWKDKSPIASG